MDTYIREPRPAVIGARVTRRDRQLLELAAEARGATLSAYIADVATRAARRDLLGAGEARQEEARETLRQDGLLAREGAERQR